MTAIWIFIAIVVLLVIWLISIYNGLVRLRTKIDNSWSDIRVFLKKRFDLIPNLVSTVKGYAEHEKTTFEDITAARAAVGKVAPDDLKGLAEANQQLNSALGRLLAIAENYPELKASANFIELQKSLQGIETDLGNARRYYNATVRDYNIAIQQFPAVMIAGSMGFSKREFYELENPAEEQNVEVKF